MQTKVIMAVNVSTYNLFSVWLLHKSIFLRAWLSSAIPSKLFADILKTHSLNTVDNAEKINNNRKMCELCGFSLRGS